jgi:hypothetical protein
MEIVLDLAFYSGIVVWIQFCLFEWLAKADIRNEILNYFKSSNLNNKKGIKATGTSSLFQIHLLFNRIFGAKLLSWRSFLLSASISLLVLVYFVFPMPQSLSEISKGVLFYGLLLILSASILRDYLILVKTRWVVKKISNLENGIYKLICLSLDLIFSYLISFGIIAITYFFYTFTSFAVWKFFNPDYLSKYPSSDLLWEIQIKVIQAIHHLNFSWDSLPIFCKTIFLYIVVVKITKILYQSSWVNKSLNKIQFEKYPFFYLGSLAFVVAFLFDIFFWKIFAPAVTTG